MRRWKPLKINLFTGKSLPVKYLAAYLAEGMAIFGFTGFLFFNSLWGIGIMLPFSGVYVYYRKNSYMKQMDSLVLKGFSDGIMSVLVGLSAGYSVENAFISAASELAGIYGEKAEVTGSFRRIAYEISVNRNIEDILMDYAQSTGLEDIKSFAEVFKIAKRRGGDLNEVIKNTISSIREKADTLRQIQTSVSSQKMQSYIMMAVPLCIILYLRIASPDLMYKMYGNSVGISVMAGCLLAYMGAVILALKIVDIQV